MPVTRGKDIKGPFYRYGTHGAKYRYIAGNVQSRNAAKRKAFVQGYAITKSMQRHGGALTDLLPSFIKNRLPVHRGHAPPVVRQAIEKMGATPIISIRVCREPVSSAITTIGNLLTSGHLERIRKALNYDAIFHLYMVLHFSNGAVQRVDKNQVVHISERGDSGQILAVGNPNCDLAEFFRRGEQSAGSADNYWHYTPEKYNCQRFVIDSLRGSHLLTPAIEHFVLQDAEKLLPPGLIRRVANALTGIAARADTVIHGRGRLVGGRKRRARRHSRRFGRGTGNSKPEVHGITPETVQRIRAIDPLKQAISHMKQYERLFIDHYGEDELMQYYGGPRMQIQYYRGNDRRHLISLINSYVDKLKLHLEATSPIRRRSLH